eukprot:2884523-Amphidinium_carterae.1
MLRVYLLRSVAPRSESTSALLVLSRYFTSIPQTFAALPKTVVKNAHSAIRREQSKTQQSDWHNPGFNEFRHNLQW